MTAEIMLMGVMCGITLLSYMIAINSRGTSRLILSYLIATILLAGSVWVIVQYVHTNSDARKSSEMQRLELENRKAEQQVLSQADSLRLNKERLVLATKLNAIITAGSGYASSLLNVDLQDKSTTLEAILAHASDLKKKTDELRSQFDNLKTGDPFFASSSALIRDALQSLSEATSYFKSYYYSENSDQEQLRDRLLRQRARSAYDQLQKASDIIATTSF